MTLVLIEKDLVLGGLTFKNRGYLGSRYMLTDLGQVFFVIFSMNS